MTTVLVEVLTRVVHHVLLRLLEMPVHGLGLMVALILMLPGMLLENVLRWALK